MKNLNEIGRKLSYFLRHNPEELIMDDQGYVNVDSVLKKLNIDEFELDTIVETDNKSRFSFNITKDKIRANQGHSIKGIELDMKIVTPPNILYHGTSLSSYEKIKNSNHIDKMQRQYVHLTDKIDTAYSVGKRYSKKDEPIILRIDTNAMYNDGFVFKLSSNNVYQVDIIPIKYIILG